MKELSGGDASFWRLAESALLVCLGTRIDPVLNDKVLNLAYTLREMGIPGLVDLTPAYSSLLVTFDPDITDGAEIELIARQHLVKQVRTSAEPIRQEIEIPAAYGGEDGPDLPPLASQHGLTPGEAIALHSSKPYRVYFIGFMPGFPYMAEVDQRIATPRLATPRVRVPSGSIGIAGVQTGIYPFSTPGGWRLIARTSIALWDPFRSGPSLLRAGDSVRFVQVENVAAPRATAHRPNVKGRPSATVVTSGGICTVQDLGRPGYSDVGLAAGGAFDRSAAMRANALVGNDPGAALLELTWSGPTLQVERSFVFALTGADLRCMVDGVPVPTGLSWFVRAGATIRFGGAYGRGGGIRGYMALSGGVDVPKVLGSCSTFPPGSFGGFEGRAISQGDVLGVGARDHTDIEQAGRVTDEVRVKVPGRGINLGVLRYKGPASVTSTLASSLLSSVWAVSGDSDRVGVRLNMQVAGTNVVGRNIVKQPDVISFGVVRGAIQVPPDGSLIILGPDRQTTGGYPLLGVVAEADWPLLAQLSSGDTVKLTEVTLAEALAARSAMLKSYSEMPRGL